MTVTSLAENNTGCLRGHIGFWLDAPYAQGAPSSNKNFLHEIYRLTKALPEVQENKVGLSSGAHRSIYNNLIEVGSLVDTLEYFYDNTFEMPLNKRHRKPQLRFGLKVSEAIFTAIFDQKIQSSELSYGDNYFVIVTGRSDYHRLQGSEWDEIQKHADELKDGTWVTRSKFSEDQLFRLNTKIKILITLTPNAARQGEHEMSSSIEKLSSIASHENFVFEPINSDKLLNFFKNKDICKT